MKTFKTFFEQKALGLVEPIKIEGVGELSAKVDSGNGGYNVLHGVQINVNLRSGIKTVTFTTVDGKKVSKPLKEYIDINIGSGNIEQRPVVAFDIEIDSKKYNNVKFSLADRSQNEEKVLLGKTFIAALGGLIDVTK